MNSTKGKPATPVKDAIDEGKMILLEFFHPDGPRAARAVGSFIPKVDDYLRFEKDGEGGKEVKVDRLVYFVSKAGKVTLRVYTKRL